MMTLAKLLVRGRRAAEFVPPGYRLIQTWTTEEWEKVWKQITAERPPAWKTLPRASHEQLERLAPGNFPRHMLDGLLYCEAKQFVARVEEDVKRGHCWKLLVDHEALNSR